MPRNAFGVAAYPGLHRVPQGSRLRGNPGLCHVTPSAYPKFTVTPQQVTAWHRREAEACVQEKNPAAALFHTLYGGDPHWAVPCGLPRP